MSTQIDLGPVLSVPKGDWNADTTYERLNLVRYNSASWICNVATSKGVEPTEDSTDWYLQVKDTSSVTSVNGMKGDVVVETAETPSANDSSTRIATTEWVTNKLGDVDLSGIKDDTIEAALNAGSLEIGTGDLTSAELATIIENNATALRVLITEEVAKKLSKSGDILSGPLEIEGTDGSIYTIFPNPDAHCLVIAALDNNRQTKNALYLHADVSAAVIRSYADDGTLIDMRLAGNDRKVYLANQELLTANATAYAATRTPNVRGVAFTGTSYTLPSGGSWCALFVSTADGYCGGWNNVAGGTTLNLGINKTWRGIIAQMI